MMKTGAAFLPLTILSLCSTNDDMIGKWVYAKAPYSPYHENTLQISKTDTGLICIIPHGKYIIEKYSLDQNNSFTSKFMIGCFSYDLTYKLRLHGKDSLTAYIINNTYIKEAPTILAYKRVPTVGISPQNAPSQ